MSLFLALLAAAAVFATGVYLSAFFSGIETAFYRVSRLRLTVDATAGDPVAGRLLNFAANPARFVATTLVGNNVANYLTTLAVGVACGALFAGGEDGGGGWVVEVGATWLAAPFVFVGGELLPKQLCYLAPGHFLRRASWPLRMFSVLFAPVAVPLGRLASLLDRGGPEGGARRAEVLFGRKRLGEVLDAGHRAGLLTDVQDRLIEALLAAVPGPVTDAAVTPDRVHALPVDAGRETVREFARRLDLREVLLRTGARGGREFAGYVTAAAAALAEQPRDVLRPLVEIPGSHTKLEALLALRREHGAVGLVTGPDGAVAGVVFERTLLADLLGRTGGG